MYSLEFIICLGRIYDYTQLVLILKLVYSTVYYYVRTISIILYTLYIYVHNLEHVRFFNYSHNKTTVKSVETTNSPI